MHPRGLKSPSATRPKVSNREMDALVKMAWDQGWWCVKGSKHVKCYPPDDGRMVPIPGTPSDHRSRMNTLKQLQRSGLRLDQ